MKLFRMCVSAINGFFSLFKNDFARDGGLQAMLFFHSFILLFVWANAHLFLQTIFCALNFVYFIIMRWILQPSVHFNDSVIVISTHIFVWFFLFFYFFFLFFIYVVHFDGFCIQYFCYALNVQWSFTQISKGWKWWMRI